MLPKKPDRPGNAERRLAALEIQGRAPFGASTRARAARVRG
jgi:hypothetical protein